MIIDENGAAVHGKLRLRNWDEIKLAINEMKFSRGLYFGMLLFLLASVWLLHKPSYMVCEAGDYYDYVADLAMTSGTPFTVFQILKLCGLKYMGVLAIVSYLGSVFAAALPIFTHNSLRLRHIIPVVVTSVFWTGALVYTSCVIDNLAGTINYFSELLGTATYIVERTGSAAALITLSTMTAVFSFGISTNIK